MTAVGLVKVKRMGETDGGFRVLEFIKENGVPSGTVMVHTSAQLGENVWVHGGSPIGPYSSLDSGSVVNEKCHVGYGVQAGKELVVEPGTSIGRVRREKEGLKKGKAPEVVIGNNCHIGPGCTISPKVKIGNNVYVGSGCQIEENCVIDDDAKVGDNYTLKKGVKIPKGGRLKYTAKRVSVTPSNLGDYLVKKKKK